MDPALGQSVLDALDLQLVAIDQNANIVFANAAWLQTAGNSAEQAKQSVIGSHYRDLCAAACGPGPDDVNTAIAGIQAVLSGKTKDYSQRYSRPFGEQLQHFELNVRAVKSPDAKAVVTHRKMATVPGAHAGTTTTTGINTGNNLDFEQMFEHSANEIFLGHSQTMEVHWINKRARTNLGYTLEEIRALPPLAFLAHVNAEEIQSTLQELLDGSQQVVEMQTIHIRKDGSQYPVMAQLQVMELDGQEMLVATAQDVSDRVNTRRELVRARMYLESAPDAMVVADQDGLIVAVNNQTIHLLGYARKELLGSPVEQLIPERFHKQHIEHRGRFATNPKVRAMGAERHLFARTKDGRELPIEVSLSPMNTGDQILIAAALRDITARLAMEEARLASDAKYRELFENSSDLIQSFNSEGKIEFVNPAWLRAMEYTEDQLSSLSFMDLIAPQSKESAEEITAQLRQGATINDIHITYLTRTGKELHLEGSATWLVADGKRLASRAILHDVTAFKHNEVALREAKELAEQANQGKSRFLAAASHDLRQPLQALRLYLSVLQRQASEPKLLDVAAKMSTSLDTMAELLDALLDISRLEGGAVEPEISELSVRDLLQGIFTSNVPQAQEKGLTLELTGADYTVRSDPGLLARIIDNFVSNAIRYTPEGGITLHSELDDNRVLVSVRDTGVGIPQDQIGRVFEEYYQIENSTRDRRKGLGLGLSIVKHIANLLEVPIDVASISGEGSTFTISLPLVEADTGDAYNREDPAGSNTLANDNSVTILFVDDDPAIVDATAMLLETADFEVHTVLDGDEAIAALDAGPKPDVLVTDYRLPGHNGVEIARHAKAVYGEELPIVLMTGDTNIKELEDADTRNLTLLRKPVDTDALITLIEQLSS